VKPKPPSDNHNFAPPLFQDRILAVSPVKKVPIMWKQVSAHSRQHWLSLLVLMAGMTSFSDGFMHTSPILSAGKIPFFCIYVSETVAPSFGQFEILTRHMAKSGNHFLLISISTKQGVRECRHH
jgi:hypothetical protein